MSVKIDQVSGLAVAALEGYADLAGVPVLSESLPQTVKALGDLEVASWQDLKSAEAKALNDVGLAIYVLSLGGGTLFHANKTSVVNTICDQFVLVSSNQAVNFGNGIGMQILVAVDHAIKAVCGRPVRRGESAFRLAPGAFGRVESAAGVLTYIINFEINVVIR